MNKAKVHIYELFLLLFWVGLSYGKQRVLLILETTVVEC